MILPLDLSIAVPTAYGKVVKGELHDRSLGEES